MFSLINEKNIMLMNYPSWAYFSLNKCLQNSLLRLCLCLQTSSYARQCYKQFSFSTVSNYKMLTFLAFGSFFSPAGLMGFTSFVYVQQRLEVHSRVWRQCWGFLPMLSTTNSSKELTHTEVLYYYNYDLQNVCYNDID